MVVGGGAGGLELVTRLGEKLGRKHKARVMLVDRARRHVWKPMLHEVAAGSLDLAAEALDYMAQAHWHGFHFRLGEMVGLDREKRLVHVAPFVDEEGMQFTPARSFPYDTLVLAIGSHTNDFGTPGVKEHARRLETARDADHFHRLLVNACIRANAQPEPLREEQLDVAIIGAGATGVELAAELHNMTRQLIDYGLDRIDAERDVDIHLIEAAPRILPGLPPPMSEAAAEQLRALGHQAARVVEGLRSARQRGQAFRRQDHSGGDDRLGGGGQGRRSSRSEFGLDNQSHQPDRGAARRCRRRRTRTSSRSAIAPHARWAGKEKASTCRRARRRRTSRPRTSTRRSCASCAGKPLQPFAYQDFGSLVSISEYSTVGNLMGGVLGGNLYFQGYLARLMYMSLHKMHDLALHGYWKVGLDTLAGLISRRTESHVKLH